MIKLHIIACISAFPVTQRKNIGIDLLHDKCCARMHAMPSMNTQRAVSFPAFPKKYACSAAHNVAGD
jgi:hypothetical protein